MDRISTDEFERLTAGAEIVARNDAGPSVMRLADGRMLKIFRRRRLLSSDLISPYAARFARAAGQLRERSIPTVEVERILAIAAGESAVIYRPLEGPTVRELIANAGGEGSKGDIIEPVARFFGQLHDKGIYFRGIHFGNIIICCAGPLGLIDIASVRCLGRSLTPAERIRNFKPPLRYPEDRAAIEAFGAGRFIDEYLAAARLGAAGSNAFRSGIARLDPIFTNGARAGDGE